MPNPRPKRRPWNRFAVVVTAAVVTWAIAVHWPLALLVHARMTRVRPGPAAKRYMLAHFYDSAVVRDLARNRIYAGQPLDEVVERYGTFRMTVAGRYAALEEPGNYVMSFENFRIVARDGELVGAGWYTCTADIEFFNTLTKAEWQECDEAIRERQRQIGADRRDAWRAVTGAVAVEVHRDRPGRARGGRAGRWHGRRRAARVHRSVRAPAGPRAVAR